MRLPTVAALALSVFTGDVASSEETEAVVSEIIVPAPGDTITVGYPAEPYSFPSTAKMVLGRFNSSASNPNWEAQPGCTASLISPQVIITAQHCVVDDRGQLEGRVSVRFRATERSTVQTQTIDLTTTNTFLKEDAFSVLANGALQFNSANDLALVELVREVDDAQVRVVRVATQGDLATYDSAIFAGWGLQLATADGLALRLAYLNDISLVGQTTFTSPVLQFRRPATYQGQVVSAGVCNGDSGGPVFISPDGLNDNILLIGVIQGVSPSGGTAVNCALPNSTSYAVGLISNSDFVERGLIELRAN